MPTVPNRGKAAYSFSIFEPRRLWAIILVVHQALPARVVPGGGAEADRCRNARPEPLEDGLRWDRSAAVSMHPTESGINLEHAPGRAEHVELSCSILSEAEDRVRRASG